MRAARARYIGYPTPLSILGSKCVVWFKADRFDIATGVSRMYDRAKGSAQDAVQATTSRQPASGVGSAGRNYVKGDKVDDYLQASLSATIAVASRPYFWVVYRAITSSPATVPIGFSYSGDSLNIAYLVIDSPTVRCGLVSTDTGAGEAIYGPAYDTNLHLHEMGFLATGVGRYVVDGIPYNGTNTGGTFRACDRVFMNAFMNISVSNFSDAEIYECVLADSLPNAEQVAQMRDYFRRSYQLAIAA